MCVEIAQEALLTWRNEACVNRVQAVLLFPLMRLDLSRNALEYFPDLTASMPMVPNLKVCRTEGGWIESVLGWKLA